MAKQNNKQNNTPEATETVTANDFVNPLKAGVSYKDFTNALGEKSVREYLQGKEKSPGVEFDNEDITWLESEIQMHKNK